MTIPILEIYSCISVFILFFTAILALNEELPKEIENFYDWLFYGIFWIFIVLKYLRKWFIKLIKL